MHTRRFATHARAALVIVIFTALAAASIAATKSIRPAVTHTPTPATSTPTAAAPFHTAPAACPMPAGVFNVR